MEFLMKKCVFWGIPLLFISTALTGCSSVGEKAISQSIIYGTAAVISPVGKIVDHGKEICLPSGMTEMGPVTKKLYDTLTGIQMGKIKAPEGWIRTIC